MTMTDTTSTGDDTSAADHNDPTSTADDHSDAPDKDAELARWKAQSRRHEDRAKANAAAAKELADLKAQSMSELERAIAETKTTTRAEVLREFGETRVADHVRVAAAGRTVDVEALLDGLDRSRFVDDDGQPDTKAIQQWVDRVAPATDETGRVPQVRPGPRGSGNGIGDDAQQFAAFRAGQIRR